MLRYATRFWSCERRMSSQRLHPLPKVEVMPKGVNNQKLSEVRKAEQPRQLCKCGCGAATEWSRGKVRWKAYVDGHYRSDAPYKNPEWLREHYTERRMTTHEIAAEFGVAHSSVLKAMNRAGIPRRSRSDSRVGRHAGAKNPAWKGGVTPDRQRIYRSGEWKRLLLAVWTRDGFRCARCAAPKSRQRILHAHHVRSWADAPELRLDIDNLKTLCAPCHLWVHSRANSQRLFLAPA